MSPVAFLNAVWQHPGSLPLGHTSHSPVSATAASEHGNIYSTNSIQSAPSIGIEEYGAISRNPIRR
jgi:hypothetical protein